MNQLLVSLMLLLCSCYSYAEKINVAVASNFTATAKELAQLFEQEYGSQVVLSFGSTGKLYAQIQYGAPFDVFLAADDVRPQALIDKGSAVKGSNFTYAQGQLALYSKGAELIDFDPTNLSKLFLSKQIALANPKTAPYGYAAVNALKKLNAFTPQQTRFIYGENIAQTYQFIETGNVSFAFVSLSQLRDQTQGSYWVVPRTLHAPIKQNAVLLAKGANNTSASQFMAFLKSPHAQSLIKQHGYYL